MVVVSSWTRHPMYIFWSVCKSGSDCAKQGMARGQVRRPCQLLSLLFLPVLARNRISALFFGLFLPLLVEYVFTTGLAALFLTSEKRPENMGINS
jgi:hypothetical protein